MIEESSLVPDLPAHKSNRGNGDRDRESIAICIVGPGWRFTSGLSYYTCRLANAIQADHHASVIQLRHLVPRWMYPGRQRVGETRNRMSYDREISVCNGLDWWWGPSLIRALSFMRAQQPRVLLMEWWTAATLHTYLALAIAARVLGIRIVLEVHELQDPSEAAVPVLRTYGRWGLRLLLRFSRGCVVHSKADWRSLEEGYISEKIRVALAPHGPFDQYRESFTEDSLSTPALDAVKEAPRPSVVNLLFFGLIRPYKGLEDLLHVFNDLSSDEVSTLWLTVVGETWDGCTEPARLIETSPHRDRITFVNAYVPDEVVAAAFAHADVAVLPYRRSSSSGILHIAMNWGLPIVVSSVGGLPEAASGYDGAVFIPPGDREALKTAIKTATQMAGQRFKDPRDWRDTVDAILGAADLGAADLDSDRLDLPMDAPAH